MRRCSTLFGHAGARRVFRRVLCEGVAPRNMRICTILREVVYKNDPRYNLAASDPEYARLFPVKRGWWSVCSGSQTPHKEVTVELLSAPSSPHDAPSSSPVWSKTST